MLLNQNQWFLLREPGIEITGTLIFGFMRYWTARRSKRYDALVIKEATRTLTQDESVELDYLEQIREERINRDMDRRCPGWREREKERQDLIEKLFKGIEIALDRRGP